MCDGRAMTDYVCGPALRFKNDWEDREDFKSGEDRLCPAPDAEPNAEPIWGPVASRTNPLWPRLGAFRCHPSNATKRAAEPNEADWDHVHSLTGLERRDVVLPHKGSHHRPPYDT